MNQTAYPLAARVRRGMRLTVMAAIVAAAWHGAAAEEAASASAISSIVIISATPLPGAGLPYGQVPSNVQSLARAQVEDSGNANVADMLNRHLGSVAVNELQGNPLQADVNYRGFTASPLLGTPQGLSVYLDGVRLNQPFGDVVSWDLIPHAAIDNVTLMPGSNPLFGLNTLGGALSFQTKDGVRNPGTAVQALLGRHGRKAVEFEHGGSNAQGWNWFVTGNGFNDHGWRDESPTRAGQLFGKLGWADARTDVALTAALANGRLNGNGLQEQRLLASDYRSVYTKPDQTRNRSALLVLAASHNVGDALKLSGNAYYRRIRTSTYNGDVNDDSLDQSVYQPNAAERAALATAGYTGVPASGANAANTPFPSLRCIANVLRGDEPAEKCNGLINRTASSQRQAGVSGQATWQNERHQFTAGGAYDASHTRFRQSAQFGYLTPDRGIQAVDFYADGTETGDDGNPVDSRVDLAGRSRTWSLFATDTMTFDRLHVTVAGRYNRTTMHNRDQITPGGGPGSLDGDHRFSRFNPALGATYDVSRHTNLYAGYSEGSRTPTAVELGCADPANPCKLPNAMAGDPPLRQVVTQTWEAGVRGTLGHATHWNAGLFRASNRDDILFVADNTAGFGYFRNVGRTRRQGAEFGFDTALGDVSLSANATWLEATFQSAELLNGAANSSKDDNGNIAIHPGDRLPLMPSRQLKLHAGWQATPAVNIGLGMQAVSSSTARGNENGQHQPDGVYFLGAGKSPGYALFDLSLKVQITPRLSLFAQVNNLLDRRYATAAQLGTTAFTAGGNFIARPYAARGDNATLTSSTFYAPGAPRMMWAGLRYEFGK